MHLYRALLVFYPRSFRERFRDEMLLDFQDARREIGTWIWLRTITDIVTAAPRARLEEGIVKSKLAGIALLVLIVGGGTLMVTGIGPDVRVGFVPLLILAGVLAIFGIAAAVSRSGAERTYAAGGRRWWWIPAALLGAFQVVMGVGQLVDDPKTTNVTALLLFLGFAGLIFAGMRVRNRVAGNWMITLGVLPMVPFVWMIAPPILALIVIVMAVADNLRATRTAQPA